VKARSLLQYRKDPRFVAALSIFIFLSTTAVYYLIQQARELSPDALSNRVALFVLWNINLILILGILFVTIRNLIKLLIERRRGILGSRFRTKVVATYIATSLVPIVLLFLVANDLLRVSVDRWFNMPVQRILENGEVIAQRAQDEALARARRAAAEIASSATTDRNTDDALLHVRRFHDVDLVGVYDNGLVVRLIANPRAPLHELREPSPSFFDEIREHGYAEKIDVVPDGKWLRYGSRIGPSPTRTALAGVFLPASINRLIDESIIAHRNFQQLDSQRSALKASQTSMFLTATLYILFGTLWIAIYISRRITVPVKALAEGTRTLAEGNYGHRIGIEAADEFGSLIESFNRMAGELESQRGELTETNRNLQDVNRRLDEERDYLSTVLASVSTGIIAFDEELRLLSINPAAREMLRVDDVEAGTPLADCFPGDLAPIAHCIDSIARGDVRHKEVTLVRGGDLRYLEVMGAKLGDTSARNGWVVALEDTTQVVQAQKIAAWSEAARRIAHEIKNPLTPIQLSAERIARKHREGDGDVDRVVDEGTRTIVEEVSHLKEMVDEFSRFARMPAIHLRETDIVAMMNDVARLYADVKPTVVVRVESPGAVTAVVDPDQFRRALINLLDNAMAATDEGTITLSAERGEHVLRVAVADTGHGVSHQDRDKLFLPYFSTKGEGTGLGLAIVHRIIHDHDGRITVHDNEPRGTRFEIEIGQ